MKSLFKEMWAELPMFIKALYLGVILFDIALVCVIGHFVQKFW